jgi:hypothetical protein
VYSVTPQGRTRAYIVGLCKERTQYEGFAPPPPVPRLLPVSECLALHTHFKYAYHYNDPSNPIHAELMEHATDPDTVYSYRSRKQAVERRVSAPTSATCAPRSSRTAAGTTCPSYGAAGWCASSRHASVLTYRAFLLATSSHARPRALICTRWLVTPSAMHTLLYGRLGERLWDVLP